MFTITIFQITLYIVDLGTDIYTITTYWEEAEIEEVDYDELTMNNLRQRQILASELTRNPFYVNLSILMFSGIIIALVSIFGVRSFKELWTPMWQCFTILVLCMFHCGPIVLIIFSKYLYHINDIHRYNKL